MNRSRIPFVHHRSAFTLIELLVVIAIVGLLAALTIAGIGKARQRAGSLREVSNLRQVFSGIALYAGDNNNAFPATDGRVVNINQPWRWYGTAYNPGQETTHRSPLMDCLKIEVVRELNKLTIAKANQTATTLPATENAYGFPYVVNYNIMPNSVGAPLVRMHQITTPSRKILMADSDKFAWGPGFFHNAGLTRIGYPDDGKTRILWADGHVSKETKDYITQNAALLIPINN